MDKLYDLDDVCLIPRVVSTVKSRDEIKPSVELFPGVSLSVPIIAAPMMDVCNGAFAKRIRELGGFGFIHRFSSIGEQVKEFYDSDKQGGCAIGCGEDFLERYNALYNAGCRYFCLDIANGANTIVEQTLQKVARDLDHVYWIVGNVASKETYYQLSTISGICGIRIGIGGGKGCSTTDATGISHPMGSLLSEIEFSRKGMIYGYPTMSRIKESPLAIADGGINSPDRFCKALALGADCVMMGSGLATAKEAPSQKVNGFTYRNGKRPYDPMGHVVTMSEMIINSAIFRGSASFEVQKEYREPRYIEGKEILLDYNGESLEQIITKFMAGLRSSMSYFNARTLEEFRTNASWGIKNG